MNNVPLLKTVRWIGILGSFLFGLATLGGFKTAPVEDFLLFLLITILFAITWRIAGQRLKYPKSLETSPSEKLDRGVMASIAKSFFALVVLLSGGLILLAFVSGRIDYLEDYVAEVTIGVLLFAAGLTFFWTQTGWYKR
jgi:hypothetical protein